MLTGGRASFAPGGYFKSPLDPLLPVSMELRQEHRKLSLAIVVALDRSGSMAMPVAGGRVKMDLANLGTVQVLDLLGPADEFGCIAVDTEPHTIAPLGRVTNKGPIRDKILRIKSEGGGIYIYEALEAAYDMVRIAKAGTKHIILFSDAADAEEPKAYKTIDRQVPGRGDHRQRHRPGHREGQGRRAAQGHRQPRRRPGLLLRSPRRTAAAVRPGHVRRRPEHVPRRADAVQDRRRPVAADEQGVRAARRCGGYNLCYLRPTANLAAVTLDEYKAPVVAAWQSGAGRVLCYTGEADGKYTGPIAQWQDAGDFFTSLARWTAGKNEALPAGVALVQERRKGITSVKLHLDPDRKQDPFTAPPAVAVLRAVRRRAAGRREDAARLDRARHAGRRSCRCTAPRRCWRPSICRDMGRCRCRRSACRTRRNTSRRRCEPPARRRTAPSRRSLGAGVAGASEPDDGRPGTDRPRRHLDRHAAGRRISCRWRRGCSSRRS